MWPGLVFRKRLLNDPKSDMPDSATVVSVEQAS